MILNAYSGARGVLVDRDTGARIPLALWADTDTGEYVALRTLDGQKPLRDGCGRVIKYSGRANLAFVEAKFPATYKPKPSAPPVPEELVRKGVRIVATAANECEEKGCHQWANWQVGHEQVIEPAVGEDGKRYERGVLTELHYYCNAHYRPPVSVSTRGVESEVNPGLARPQ